MNTLQQTLNKAEKSEVKYFQISYQNLNYVIIALELI